MNKSPEEKVACLKREIALRQVVYPARVVNGKMTAEKAHHEVVCMQEVLEDLIVRQRTMLFSKRMEIAVAAEGWLKERNHNINPVNLVTALCELGYVTDSSKVRVDIS